MAENKKKADWNLQKAVLVQDGVVKAVVFCEAPGLWFWYVERQDTGGRAGSLDEAKTAVEKALGLYVGSES